MLNDFVEQMVEKYYLQTYHVEGTPEGDIRKLIEIIKNLRKELERYKSEIELYKEDSRNAIKFAENYKNLEKQLEEARKATAPTWVVRVIAKLKAELKEARKEIEGYRFCKKHGYILCDCDDDMGLSVEEFDKLKSDLDVAVEALKRVSRVTNLDDEPTFESTLAK